MGIPASVSEILLKTFVSLCMSCDCDAKWKENKRGRDYYFMFDLAKNSQQLLFFQLLVSSFHGILKKSISKESYSLFSNT